MSITSVIRYPGSKAKLAAEIFRRAPDSLRLPLWHTAPPLITRYVEPFYGAGHVGIYFLMRIPRHCTVTLSDSDYWIICMWNAIRDDHRSLERLVECFNPSPEAFYQFKEEDGRRDIDVVQAGFRKLVLHRISWSGLGAVAGGPLGGKDQENAEHPVGCRWSAANIRRGIRACHAALQRFRRLEIRCRHFRQIIPGCCPNTFLYCDPPYYEKGGQLYKNSMDESEHRELAQLLKSTKASWLLSYDDHPAVREMYSWARIEEVNLTYTVAGTNGAATRRKNSELLISPLDSP